MELNMSGHSYSGYNKKEKCTIDKIRELQLDVICIEKEYDIIKEIGSGDYGKVLLATHKKTNTEVALKAVPKATTTLKDFWVEFHYSYFLSPHSMILDTYDVAFEASDYYCFAQEVAPLGDVWQAVERTCGAGLIEKDVKIIVEQMTSAIEFMHQKNLVHRDIRAENILVFSPDFGKVKLTDFGLTRKAGTLVKKRTRSLPTCPPEIWETLHLEGYHVELGSDVWQLAMLIFITTQARFPWEKADITDIRFNEFVEWQKRKTTKVPREFRRFTHRILRLFRRLMEIKPSKRYPITELNKYFKDQWLNSRVSRQHTMYVSSSARQNASHNMLEVPSLRMTKRESVSAGSLYSPGVSRSLSCSHLMFTKHQLPADGSSANFSRPQTSKSHLTYIDSNTGSTLNSGKQHHFNQSEVNYMLPS